MSYKAIDISTLTTKEELAKIKLQDLIEDAAARKDKKAYEWLRDVAKANQECEPKSRRRINSIRMEYLTKFCGFKSGKAKSVFKSKNDEFIELLASIEDVFK